MKKLLICNIKMNGLPSSVVYQCPTQDIPVSKETFYYPVNSYLSQTLTPEDEYKVLMLVKKNDQYDYKELTGAFMEELNQCNEKIGAKIEYVTVDTEFEESQDVHSELIKRVVDEIEDGSQLLVDMTFGPKDQAILLFTILHFAEKFLGCDLERILYGKSVFNAEGKIIQSDICDMDSLYYL
nr:hypothetical protein [Eubacterium sp.]